MKKKQHLILFSASSNERSFFIFFRYDSQKHSSSLPTSSPPNKHSHSLPPTAPSKKAFLFFLSPAPPSAPPLLLHPPRTLLARGRHPQESDTRKCSRGIMRCELGSGKCFLAHKVFILPAFYGCGFSEGIKTSKFP